MTTAINILQDEVVRWGRFENGAHPLFVAFSSKGIHFSRLVESMDGRTSNFLAAHKTRFGAAPDRAREEPGDIRKAIKTGRYEKLKFDFTGVGEFQRQVLEATASISRGQTRSYGWVAKQIGRPAAVRAVGTALGRNPVPILIPCHRVTRADGQPGNYMYGPRIKAALLQCEGAHSGL